MKNAPLFQIVATCLSLLSGCKSSPEIPSKAQPAERPSLVRRLKTVAAKANLQQESDIELRAIRQLVDLYVLDRKYDKAELAAWRAVRIRETTSGHDQTAIVSDLCKLSRIYTLENKEKERRDCLDRTTGILNSYCGPDHLYTKITLFELRRSNEEAIPCRPKKRRVASYLRNGG